MKRRLPQVNNKDRRDGTGRRVTVLVITATVCIAVVAGFGWRQFKRRADPPIGMVKEHAIPGTEVTIGEGIEEFVTDRDIKVADEGFKPSWGAEQTSNDEWVVSYVFEVGRQSRWISWKVYPKSGKVLPCGDFAEELWEGR